MLEASLASVLLFAAEDDQRLTLCGGPKGKLQTGALYRLCRIGGVSFPSASFIWNSHTSSWVKFFVWLLVQSRIHTRNILLRKTIIAADGASCPLCTAKLETPSHMALQYPMVAPFRVSLGVLILRDARVRGFHLLQTPSEVAVETAPAFALHIWS
jgi:hypothetical protein